jgi:hypothetical protein
MILPLPIKPDAFANISFGEVRRVSRGRRFQRIALRGATTAKGDFAG